MATIESVNLNNTGMPAQDPLAEEIGRCYAAAPLVGLVLGMLAKQSSYEITGVDGHTLSITMGVK